MIENEKFIFFSIHHEENWRQQPINFNQQRQPPPHQPHPQQQQQQNFPHNIFQLGLQHHQHLLGQLHLDQQQQQPATFVQQWPPHNFREPPPPQIGMQNPVCLKFCIFLKQ